MFGFINKLFYYFRSCFSFYLITLPMEINKNLNRKDFFAAIGVSTAAIAVFTCLGGCSKNAGGTINPTVPTTGVDFTLDLTTNANAALKTNGGFVVSQGIIVARTSAGVYIAVQQSCTHAQYPLEYQPGNHRFYCNNHGSTFTETGAVTTGPAQTSLIAYKTTLTGNSLRVQS